MKSVVDALNRLRSLSPERLLGLRPPRPPVAVEVNSREIVLVRVKRARGRAPLLEAYRARSVAEDGLPASIFQASTAPVAALEPKLRDLFEASGTRPGRVSLILPDSLAKISLIQLPERPATRRQTESLVRSRMRRTVPFRLEDASVAFQVLPGQGRGVALLVAVARRAVVESYERALENLGARPGLIDICTPNLLNLCRDGLARGSRNGGDTALLNCAGTYFTLVIVRKDRLIFFRSKTFALTDSETPELNGVLNRELAGSLSYYREKLGGTGIRKLWVRSIGFAPHDLSQRLLGLGVEHVEAVEPQTAVRLEEGVRLDDETNQRIAPTIGAVIGRAG